MGMTVCLTLFAELTMIIKWESGDDQASGGEATTPLHNPTSPFPIFILTTCKNRLAPKLARVGQTNKNKPKPSRFCIYIPLPLLLPRTQVPMARCVCPFWLPSQFGDKHICLIM